MGKYPLQTELFMQKISSWEWAHLTIFEQWYTCIIVDKIKTSSTNQFHVKLL